jgi:hypothetical protein
MATRFSQAKASTDPVGTATEQVGGGSSPARGVDRVAPLGNTVDLLDPIGDSSGEAAQGRTREIIAVWLLGLLCAIVALAFTGYFLTLDGNDVQKQFANLKTLLDVLVGPIITLLSSAIGFYFGSRTAQASARNAAAPAPTPPPPPPGPPPAPVPAATGIPAPLPPAAAASMPVTGRPS